MMLTKMKVRSYVLAAHGALSLGLGLVLLYLHATMTDLFLEVIATAIATTLLIAALMMAAATDWIAAFTCRVKHLHQVIFYVLAGLWFAAIGFYVGSYPDVSMRLLLVLAAAHAAISGAWSISFILERNHGFAGRVVVLILGLISFLFASTLFLSEHAGPSDAIALLGAYTCFIGAKMLFFALRLWRLSARGASPAPLLGTARRA